MKQISRKMISLVFAAILMILVFDSGMTVAADSAEAKNIAVGVEYRIGDVVKSEKPYYVKDDLFGTITYPIENEITLKNLFYNNGSQWCIYFSAGENSAIYLNYNCGPNREGIVAEYIRVKSGSGTQGDPYVMEIVFSYHVDLQASAGGTISFKPSNSEMTTVNVNSVSEELGSAVSLTATAVPNDHYSFSGWYEATFNEGGNINGYTGDPLFTDETITLSKDSAKTALYALFTENSTISKVSITIDPPIAGTSVTYEGQDVLSQKPVPALSVSGNCSVSTTDSGRSSAIWVNKNNILEALTGDFVAGESYMFVAGITPDQGYAFAEKKDMTVTVNGSPITSFTVDEKGSSLSFNALVTIEYSDFVCKDDDGGSWKKGSGSELSFTFDHENGGAKKEEFRFLLADDEEIEKDDKNYTVKDGSIIISLQPAYLETLSLGEHKLTAVFDGEKFVNVSFSILEKDKEEKKDDSSRKSTNRYVAPRTGVE